MTIGLLGAGGQMVLFYALTMGPAYLIFPIISLSPVITIAMSFALLGERTGKLGAARHRAGADRAADVRFLARPAARRAAVSDGSSLALIVMAVLGRAGLFHEARQQHMSARRASSST